MGFNWFWNFFKNSRAECIACNNTYAKEAMKELWFKYDNGNGSTGTASVYLCEPCADEIAKDIEDQSMDFDDSEFEVFED